MLYRFPGSPLDPGGGCHVGLPKNPAFVRQSKMRVCIANIDEQQHESIISRSGYRLQQCAPNAHAQSGATMLRLLPATRRDRIRVVPPDELPGDGPALSNAVPTHPPP